MLTKGAGDRAEGLAVPPPTPAQSLALADCPEGRRTARVRAPNAVPLEQSRRPSSQENKNSRNWGGRLPPYSPSRPGPPGPFEATALPTALPERLFAQGIKLRQRGWLPGALRPSPSHPRALSSVALPLPQATLPPPLSLPHSGHQTLSPSPPGLPVLSNLLKVNCGPVSGRVGERGSKWWGRVTDGPRLSVFSLRPPQTLPKSADPPRAENLPVLLIPAFPA